MIDTTLPPSSSPSPFNCIFNIYTFPYGQNDRKTGVNAKNMVEPLL